MNHDIRYSNKPVKPKKLTSFIPDHCQNAGTRRFTAQSLGTIEIFARSDTGLTDQNIIVRLYDCLLVVTNRKLSITTNLTTCLDLEQTPYSMIATFVLKIRSNVKGD